MNLMYCPNTLCSLDFSEVEVIGPHEFYIGTAHVAATNPICITCGCDLTPEPPSVGLDHHWLEFLNTLV